MVPKSSPLGGAGGRGAKGWEGRRIPDREELRVLDHGLWLGDTGELGAWSKVESHRGDRRAHLHREAMAVPEDRLRLRSHLQVTQRRHPLHPGGRGHKDLRLIVAEPMVLGAQKRVAARQARGAAVPAVAVGGGGVAGVEPEHRRELASRRSGGAALEPPGPAGVWCLRGHRVVLVVIVPLHSTQPHLQLCRSTAIRGGAQAILLLAHGTGEPAACLRGDRRKALLA
eukprot:CAMPEP_0175287246 /NCGR_PEP_ID=MMETSP0093-20121207/54184_1 /TAXON_ID=311494 /ORGANISM="Alexandrium monilatum, Strain CCMP3105" /LENGTH=226 /DNA_ID=CAMNT_0016582745 /DNA_START=141 /DNA_END=816 /DNA_ORIENTATION=-